MRDKESAKLITEAIIRGGELLRLELARLFDNGQAVRDDVIDTHSGAGINNRGTVDEGTPTHPDHQCPACPVEVRDLFAAASNAVAQFRYSAGSDEGWDRAYRKMRALSESLARMGSIIDRHFVEMSTRCPQCGNALIGKPLACFEHGEPGLAGHGEPGR